jgi:hypothetical protein
MPRQRRVVCQNAVIADHAVVPDMRIRHDQAMAPDARHAAAASRPPRNRHALANRVLVAQRDARRLTLVFQILRRHPNARKRMKPIPRPNLQLPVEHHV